ncbi:unnamed protein product [Trichogramma brassicae]|uniref:Endonuclease/exonuclease/phosphatase domain-containing protein n=1 Tax=Trichogramma brassicae TaxID=86971 RepID=A0A6H5IHW4_9HYME|nr:unnamed protein product [Trichogramma brassicae]
MEYVDGSAKRGLSSSECLFPDWYKAKKGRTAGEDVDKDKDKAKKEEKALSEEEVLYSDDRKVQQEPYAYKGRACALGGFSRVVITGQKGEESPWAAVVVSSPNITATHLRQHSSAHCVCVELSGAFGSVVVISQYYQFSHEPEVHIDYLDLLLSRLRSRRIIIGMDSNGTSPQWSCQVQAADERGLLLEEVIHRHGLHAVYQRGHPSTLVRGRLKARGP